VPDASSHPKKDSRLFDDYAVRENFATSSSLSSRTGRSHLAHDHGILRAIGLFDPRLARRPLLATFEVPMSSVVDAVTAAGIAAVGLLSEAPIAFLMKTAGPRRERRTIAALPASDAAPLRRREWGRSPVKRCSSISIRRQR
jgi:hypothetical protein